MRATDCRGRAWENNHYGYGSLLLEKGGFDPTAVIGGEVSSFRATPGWGEGNMLWLRLARAIILLKYGLIWQ